MSSPDVDWGICFCPLLSEINNQLLGFAWRRLVSVCAPFRKTVDFLLT